MDEKNGCKPKRWLAGLLVMALVAGYVIRIQVVRAEYAKYGVDVYQEGETVQEGAFLFTVTGSRMLSLDELGKAFGEPPEEMTKGLGNGETCFILVDLKAENITGEPAMYPFFEMMNIQGLTWMWTYSAEWASFLGSEDAFVWLMPGETGNYLLVYAVISSHFGSSWNSAMSDPIYLTFRTEARKKMIQLAFDNERMDP